MKHAIIAVTVLLGVSPTSAMAADWAINSTLSETTELNSNQFLRSMLAGGTFGSYTTIAGNAVARTPTSRFTLDGDVSYQKYWGPGAVGTPLSESKSEGVKAHYETFGKNSSDREYVDATWRRQSTALAILGDLGAATGVIGDIDTTTVAGGIERSITARDFAALSARETYTSYVPFSGGTPYFDTEALGTWKHRLSGTAAIMGSSEVQWLKYDNPSKTNLTILREKAGVDVALTPLLNLRGSVGVAYLTANQQNPAALQASTGSILSSGSGSSAGLIGDMYLSYKLFRTTELSLTADRSIGPSIIGSLVQSTTFGLGVKHDINSRSTLSFAANSTRQTSDGTTDFISASVSYGYLLTRDWNAQLSYRYLHRSGSSGSGTAFDPLTGLPVFSGSGDASSNSLMLVITRNFTVLPPGQ